MRMHAGTTQIVAGIQCILLVMGWSVLRLTAYPRQYPTQHCTLHQYTLKVTFTDLRTGTIQGQAQITFQCQPEKIPRHLTLWLHTTYQVTALFVQDTIPVPYHRKHNQIRMTIPRALRHQHPMLPVTFTIAWQGRLPRSERPPWQPGAIITQDPAGAPWLAIAVQSGGGNYWYPSWEQLTDPPETTLITLVVPDTLVAISNGQLIQTTQPAPHTRAYTWRVTYPIHHYNITFYVGQYSCWDTTLLSATNRQPPTRLPVSVCLLQSTWNNTPDSILQAFLHQDIPHTLAALERLWGPYPFARDGFKLVEAPYWGMEHQSAIAYGNHFQKNGAPNFCPFDFILFHESAHEWWGNALGGATLRDLWLHESLATYSEVAYVTQQCGDSARLRYLQMLKRRIHNEYSLYSRKRKKNPFIDTDIYFKGAWIWQTLWFLSYGQLDTTLSELLHTYFPGKPRVSTQEVLQFIHQKLGKDFRLLLRGYLRARTVPHIHVYTKNATLRVRVRRLGWHGNRALATLLEQRARSAPLPPALDQYILGVIHTH